MMGKMVQKPQFDLKENPMLFSSIPFLYYFLPLVLMIYFLVPRKMRNAWLLISSLIFYGWGEPKYLILMAASILAFYGFGLAIGYGKRKKLWLTLSVATGVVLLGVFKYAGFFTGGLISLALPIGISFYLFQCMSYGVDVYRGTVPPQRNLISFGAYVSMFPQLIAGPIVRYADIAPQLDDRKTTWEDAAYGVRRFLLGLGKKVLLANQLGMLTQIYQDSGEKSVVFAWMYAIAFCLQIYFDFSGYSDMAIGLGRVLGFRFLENFNYPYLSSSITEFWRRWHMSLGSWFRDYVYIPLGGNRKHQLRNILIVWMLTGLWHGASWNFVAWGLFFGILLTAEKFLPTQKLPKILHRILTLLAVMISFVIFNATDLTQAMVDVRGLFGGQPLITGETVYYLRSFAGVLVLSLVGATPLMKVLVARMPQKLVRVLEPVVLMGLLIVCTAYLVDGSFNPFLYFRF